MKIRPRTTNCSMRTDRQWKQAR